MRTSDAVKLRRELDKDFLREELETAWLRGWNAGLAIDELMAPQAAADYAERVVGGSTRPAKPDPLPTHSKDENSSQNAGESV